MKMEYLREFVLLSHTLNFSSTAAKLFISQSALSRHISIIEAELGSKLLERDTHSVILTKEGIEASHKFTDILTLYDSLVQKSDPDPATITGHLSVGLLYFAIAEYYGEFLQYFTDKYPGIDLTIENYHPHMLYQAVQEKKLDIGECLYSRALMQKGIVMHKLNFPVRMVALLPDTHPLAKKDSVSLTELVSLPLIDLEEDTVSSAVTQEILHNCGALFKDIHYVKHVEAAPKAVLKHQGVHITGERVSRQAYPGIRYIQIADENAVTYHSLIRLSDNPNKLVPLFIREAQTYFKENPI